jgi:putative phosphoribosyl transferase
MQANSQFREAREVRIPVDEGTLQGDLALPTGIDATVFFVNGRGRGRHCLDDRLLARQLQDRGVGTLAMDLLTPDEQQEPRHSGRHGPVDVPLLTERVLLVAGWVARQPQLQGLPLGLCGVAAGGAVALIAAARLGKQVQAVVSVGGEPEQAGPAALAAVKAPTLLLVGSQAASSLTQHDAAYQHLRSERSLAVVPGGGPLLEERGVLEHAGEMAADWFTAHLIAAEETA